MKPVVLRGSRLVLRPTGVADALAAWKDVSGRRGRALTRLMGWEPPRTRAEQRRFGALCQKGWKDGGPLIWTVLADGALAGSVGLHDISRVHRSAEIGIWIAPAFHRQGLGLEACRLVVDFGLRRLGLQRIVYPYFEGNTASAALARSLGARPEGRLRRAVRKRGRFLDRFMCGILKDEWKKSR